MFLHTTITNRRYFDGNNWIRLIDKVDDITKIGQQSRFLSDAKIVVLKNTRYYFKEDDLMNHRTENADISSKYMKDVLIGKAVQKKGRFTV